MKRLLIVSVALISLGWTLDAQAGCCRRTTSRVGIGDWQPGNVARRVLERKPVRRALARVVYGQCG